MFQEFKSETTVKGKGVDCFNKDKEYQAKNGMALRIPTQPPSPPHTIYTTRTRTHTHSRHPHCRLNFVSYVRRLSLPPSFFFLLPLLPIIVMASSISYLPRTHQSPCSRCPSSVGCYSYSYAGKMCDLNSLNTEHGSRTKNRPLVLPSYRKGCL